jgi:hypothetical protein
VLLRQHFKAKHQDIQRLQSELALRKKELIAANEQVKKLREETRHLEGNCSDGLTASIRWFKARVFRGGMQSWLSTKRKRRKEVWKRFVVCGVCPQMLMRRLAGADGRESDE